MTDEDLKLIIAQQVVILKRLEKLEQKVNGSWRLCSIQTTVNELKKEAMKIAGQITTW